MTESTIFTVGVVIFAIYMFFLVRMTYRQNKKQKEQSPTKAEDLYPAED